MNKQELAAMIAEILGTMEAEPLAKGGDYRPQPERTKTGYRDFAGKNGMVEVRAKCRGKDEYLTRPDLGRCFDEESKEKIWRRFPVRLKFIVAGDGLSSAAITAFAEGAAQVALGPREE